MRKSLTRIVPLLLACSLTGCGSGMADASLKPEVTGKGPTEPGGPVNFEKAPKAAHE